MDAPFFIVGASRSGTTLLRLLLNAHSCLAVPHEFKYFTLLPAGTAAEQWRTPGLSETHYQEFVRHFLNQRAHVFEDIGLERLEREIIAHPKRDLRTPYRIAAEAWAHHYGKTHWGEKTPHNLFYADVLADMFPAARFLYLIRDPRAVVRSMNKIDYFSRDTAINALNWRLAATRGREILTASVPAHQRMTVRYEDIVLDTEQHLQRICAFIGVSFEPSMLEFHKKSREFMPSLIRTPTVTRSVTSKHADKWKTDLSPSEIGLIESLCSGQMRTLGYEPIGATPSLKNRLDMLLKLLYWKVQQWRHRDTRPREISYRILGRTRNRLSNLLSNLFGSNSLA